MGTLVKGSRGLWEFQWNLAEDYGYTLVRGIRGLWVSLKPLETNGLGPDPNWAMQAVMFEDLPNLSGPKGPYS